MTSLYGIKIILENVLIMNCVSDKESSAQSFWLAFLRKAKSTIVALETRNLSLVYLPNTSCSQIKEDFIASYCTWKLHMTARKAWPT